MPLSELLREQAPADWVWEGVLRERGPFLLSALWKVGKSTFLGKLLSHLLNGERFLNRACERQRTLLLSEEAPAFWPARVGPYPEHMLWTLRRGLLGRPSADMWYAFVGELDKLVAEYGIDLLVVDTLAAWPSAPGRRGGGPLVTALRQKPGGGRLVPT